MTGSSPRCHNRWAPFVLATLGLLAGVGTARAQADTARGVRIGLTYTPGTKPGVLVLPVNGPEGDSIRAIIQRDLDHGDRTNVIVLTASPVDSLADGGRGPLNYPLYSRLGAAAVVQGTMTASGLHVAVHDVSRQRVERVRDFPLAAEPLSPDWRLSVHEIADQLEFWITGVRGVAASRVLYASAGRIWQIDSDGANATPLTPAQRSAMSPTWHPRATHIAYVAIPDAGAQVILREIGGATRVISGAPGFMSATPAFSPDGNTLIFSRGGENGSDLYAVNPFASEPARRITVSRGMDAISPSFSSDGRRIVYTTNRLGRPELYVADADGTNSEALTPFSFGDQGHRTNPDWSPDGLRIAFQAQIDGRFQIMTINPRDRGGLRRYTNEGVNEDPSWAPDSRHLVFTSDRSGTKQLWVLDTESNRVRQLTRAPASVRSGAWSPLLRGR
jgi:TolB protein